jgi:hypothetical protein
MDKVRKASNSEKNQGFEGTQTDIYNRFLLVTGDHRNCSVVVYDTKYKNIFLLSNLIRKRKLSRRVIDNVQYEIYFCAV